MNFTKEEVEALRELAREKIMSDSGIRHSENKLLDHSRHNPKLPNLLEEESN